MRRGALLRAALGLIAVAAWAVAAHEDAGVVMAGPTTKEALSPCDEKCLCDAPRKPMAPTVTAAAPGRLSLLFGKVSMNPICDAASQVQMDAGDGTWATVYNGPMSTHDAEKLRPDDTVRFRVRERNCAGTSEFSDVLLARTPKEDTRPPAPALAKATTSEICVSVNLTKARVSDLFNASADLVVSFRAALDAHADAVTPDRDPAFLPLEGDDTIGPAGHVWKGCATGLRSFTVYQFRLVFADPTLLETNSKVASYSTLMEVPPAPTRLTATTITSDSLTFIWSKNVTDNRSPTDIYLVDVAVIETDPHATKSIVSTTNATNYTNTTTDGNSSNSTSPDDTYQWVRVAQMPKPIVKLPGLLPGRVYACRVIAVNSVGQSLPSTVALTATTAAVPNAPATIKFTAATSDSVKVEWEAADSNGAPITSYTLQKYGGPGPSMFDYTDVYSGLNTHKRVVSLEPNTYYGFRVFATNKMGDGGESKQIFLKTPLPGDILEDADLAAASVPIDAAVAAKRALALVSHAPPTRHPAAADGVQILLADGPSHAPAPRHPTGAEAARLPRHHDRHDVADDAAFHVGASSISGDRSAVDPKLSEPSYMTASSPRKPAADTAGYHLPASLIAELTADADANVAAAAAAAAPVDPRRAALALVEAAQPTNADGTAKHDPNPAVESVGPTGDGGNGPDITDNTAPDNDRQPGPPVDVNGGCLASRAKCLEKDPTYKAVHFMCAATPAGNVSVRPTVSDFCPVLNVDTPVYAGSQLSLPPDQMYNLSQTACACECSGVESTCGAQGDLRFFTNVNGPSDCAQITCSALKFQKCHWKGEEVSMGIWGGDGRQQLTMLSPPLENCSQTAVSDRTKCTGYSDCGGFDHGRCLGNGTCLCVEGWTGVDCLSGTCPDRESGCGLHGVCVAPDTCACDKAYGGIDCLQYVTMRFVGNTSSPSRPTSVSWSVEAVEAAAAAVGAGEDRSGLPILILPEASGSTADDTRPLRPRRRTSTIKKATSAATKLSSAVPSGTRLAIPGRGGYKARYPGDTLEIDYHGNQSFTVSIWFKASSTAAKTRLSPMVTHGNPASGSGWGMGMMKGGLVYCSVGSDALPVRASNAAMAASEMSYADGRFHQLSCIFDLANDQITVAVDGNRAPLTHIFPYTGGEASTMFLGDLHVGHLNLTAYNPEAPLVVGASADMTTSFFDGWLSEMRIWSVARTPQAQGAAMWDPMTEAIQGLALCLPLNDADQMLPYTAGFRHHSVRRVHQVVHLLFSGSGGNLPRADLQFHPLVRKP